MKNKSGFSLVTVLIAAGLLAGLGLVVAQLMVKGNKAVKTTEVRMDALDFEGVIEDLLRERDACTRTFGKVTVTPTSSIVIRDGYAPGPNNILDNNGVYNANNRLLWDKDDLVIGDLKLISIKIPQNRFSKSITSTGTVTYTSTRNYTTINHNKNRGFVEMQVLLEKTLASKRTFSTKDILLKFYLTVQAYEDTGNVGDPANDLRIDWCQLAGSKIKEDTDPGCYTLRRYEKIDLNNRFVDSMGELHLIQDGLSYSDVVDSYGGCCLGSTDTDIPNTGLTNAPSWTDSGDVDRWYGLKCRKDNNFHFTNCTHSAQGGDSDFLLVEDGCFADVNDGGRDTNFIDVRCCRY